MLAKFLTLLSNVQVVSFSGDTIGRVVSFKTNMINDDCWVYCSRKVG